MKLVVAVVQEDDAELLVEALVAARLRATRIASSGGFLRAGSVTILAGVEDRQVPLVLDLLNEHCRRRTSTLPPVMRGVPDEWALPDSELVAVEVGGAVVFVLNVVRFEQL
jgi:uncharacterized protein YaaQ